jgi:hypothetical protein
VKIIFVEEKLFPIIRREKEVFGGGVINFRS